MKKRLIYFLVSIVCISGLVSRAAAAEDVAATNEEIISEVEKATGCTKDALDVVMKESPQLFEKLGDTVTGIKILNMIVEAKDPEALAEFAKWRVGKTIDDLLKRVFPASLLTALTAFKAYYAALELIRDYMVIPKFDERLYQVYKQQRSGTGGGTPEAAFTEATNMPFSGYHLIKPAMVDKYIKARGWKKDIAGDGMITNAEKQIDNFWEKRLEARYQKDQAAAQAAELRQAILAAQAQNLSAIAAAAGKIYGNDRFVINLGKILQKMPYTIDGKEWFTYSTVVSDWGEGIGPYRHFGPNILVCGSDKEAQEQVEECKKWYQGSQPPVTSCTKSTLGDGGYKIIRGDPNHAVAYVLKVGNICLNCIVTPDDVALVNRQIGKLRGSGNSGERPNVEKNSGLR